MRHTKTPSDPGWYWIANSPDQPDGWEMAYWDAERDEPRLYVFDPIPLAALGPEEWPSRGVSIWKQEDNGPHQWADCECDGTWRGPEVWIGPLSQPGGPFGSTIAEFEHELHEKAAKIKHALVMTHVEYTHCDDIGGCITTTKICPPNEKILKDDF